MYGGRGRGSAGDAEQTGLENRRGGTTRGKTKRQWKKRTGDSIQYHVHWCGVGRPAARPDFGFPKLCLLAKPEKKKV